MATAGGSTSRSRPEPGRSRPATDPEPLKIVSENMRQQAGTTSKKGGYQASLPAAGICVFRVGSPTFQNLFGGFAAARHWRLVGTFCLGKFWEAKLTTHFAAEVCTFSGAPQTVSSRDAAKSDSIFGQYCCFSGVSDLMAKCDIQMDLEKCMFY